MDSKQLVDQLLNGDITEEQFEIEKAKLSPEAQSQILKDAEAKLPDAVEKLKSVRRGIQKIASERNHEEEKSLANKMRDENFVEAKSTFFSEVGIEKEEDIKAFEEGFKKFDSGNVNTKNIVSDMKGYYASIKKDDYFTLLKEKKDREREAEEVTAQNAGGGGGGNGGGGGMQKPSKDVQDLISESQKRGITLTRDQAERRLSLARNKGRIPTS